MTPSILLLDCAYTLQEKLQRQGFSVTTGTVGFCSSTRHLPHQLYESEVIVYNPTVIARRKDTSTIRPEDINDLTPEYRLDHLKDHILGGATLLVFANHFGDGIDANVAYDWLPFMSKLVPTKDQRVSFRTRFDNWHEPYLRLNFIDISEIVLPVRLKLKHRTKLEDGSDDIGEVNVRGIEIVPLLYNRNGDVLGASFKFGEGAVYVLPTFKSNDDFVITFLNRVIPEIHGVESKKNLIDEFISPQQEKVENEIEKMSGVQKELEKRVVDSKEELVQAKLIKSKTIREDETAALILNYYDLAQQQSDVALFFLYKIIEVLEKKFGGESEAKRILKNNEGWNLIGRIANASYGDVRHAPKPGEKVKEWSSEEIKACFEAAKQISMAYFATLFEEDAEHDQNPES